MSLNTISDMGVVGVGIGGVAQSSSEVSPTGDPGQNPPPGVVSARLVAMGTVNPLSADTLAALVAQQTQLFGSYNGG